MSTTTTRRIGLLTVAALALGSGVAWAANPHFVGQVRNTGVSSNGSDTVTGKVAGLGGNATVEVKVSANVVALFACRNPGGNFPPGLQRTVNTQASASQTFTANGQFTFALTLSPNPNFSCPGPMTRVLACIEYKDKEATLTQKSSGRTLDTQRATPRSRERIFLRDFANQCRALGIGS